MKNKIK